MAAPAAGREHVLLHVGEAVSKPIVPIRGPTPLSDRTTSGDEPQYDLLARHRPEAYQKVRAAIAEGRFVPTDSMWVEANSCGSGYFR